jgi:branched-chain amino acid transport system substrate-binding protein
MISSVRWRHRLPLLLLVLLLAVTACSEEGAPDRGQASTAGPIKIGAVLDITGAGATLGVPERDTIQLLAEQVNAQGGIDGRQVEPIILDNQSKEDEAAKAASRLVTEDRVDVLLGASRTGPSLAMKPIAERAEVPMLSLAANQKIVDGARWVFKTAQNDSVVVQKLVAYMAKKGYRTVGLLRDASAFGEGVAELLDRTGAGKGVEVVAEEKFAPDATEFTAQLVRVRNARADVNLVWGIPPAVALATKAYRELGIEAPLVQSHGIGNQAFVETAGAAADGVVFPIGRLLVADDLPDSDPQKQVLTRFIADYTARYGRPPSTFAGHAYDGFQLALDAFRQVGTDPRKVRDHLERRREFVGVSGVFNFSPADHSGLDAGALVLVEIRDGDWVLASDQV